MEAEDQAKEYLYLQAFNNGYLLAKHQPELAKMLVANSNDQSSYFQGLIAGKKEYDAEVLAWAKSFNKGRSQPQNIDVTKEAERKLKK